MKFAPMNNVTKRLATNLAARSRRGTVLLLVLGALAMVLVLAVVYAALGKGDRRTATSVAKQHTMIDSRDAHAQHIIDVVANDVFDLIPEVAMRDALAVLGETAPIMRRETVDLPYTDFHYVSVPTELIGDQARYDQGAIDSLRFRPSGGHSADAIWDVEFVEEDHLADLTGIALDPRLASDPWLASTRPVDLGDGSTSLDPVIYNRQQDWLQISNFAPDGRFVNLFYLREDQGGFFAPSLDLTREDGGGSRLSLMDDNGEPTQDLPYESMLGGSGGVNADWNRPAHWTMYQRGLFRPVNDPTFTAAQSTPDNEAFFAYQYADADGDGFLDSRWIELVDFSDEGRPTSILGESDFRFFMAARAIDLSSLVNVTTATDSLTPPTTSNRIGSGAHEISLFKLLNSAERSMDIVTGDVVAYDDVFATATGQAGDYGGFSIQAMQKAGRKAYLRLLSSNIRGRGYDYGLVPGEDDPSAVLSENLADYTPFEDAQGRLVYANAIGSVYPGSTGGGNGRTSPYGIDDLVELLTFHGINDDRNFSLLEQAMTSDNESDNTLSYSLLRSDRSTVSDAWPAANDDPSEKLLRSSVDIRRMLTTLSGHRPLRSSILEAANYAKLTEEVDRKIWLDGLVLADGLYPNDDDGDDISDLNEETSELLANTFGVYMDLLAPNLNQNDWERDFNGDQDRFHQTKTQYYGHMGPELAVRLAGHMAVNFRDMADMPYIDLDQNGVPDVSSILGLQATDLVTPTGGPVSPYARRQDTSTAAVLRLSDAWTPPTGPAPTDIMGQLWQNGLKLDVEELYNSQDPINDPQHIALSAAENVSHDAMILYGIEPQPFIGQVSSMTMYTDVAPGNPIDDQHTGSATDDGEWILSPANGGAGDDGFSGTEDDFDGLPNIKGEAEDANADFLFQALFFQLFNPFDVPVVLDDYYLEFADSFFSVNDGLGGPVVLQPRSTVVLFISNPAEDVANRTTEVSDRLRNANLALPLRSSPNSEFVDMVITQTGLELGNTLIPLASRYSKPASGSLGGSGTYSRVLPGDVRDFFYGDPGNKSDVNRVVLLWRDNPDYVDPATGRLDWTASSLNTEFRSTDQLVDRLRDTSGIKTTAVIGGGSGPFRASLDRRLDLPTRAGPNGELLTINDAVRGNAVHRAAPDNLDPEFFALGNGWLNYNFTGQLGVALWGNISRKDDSTYESGRASVDYYTNNMSTTATVGSPGNEVVNGTPVGALPAQVFEPTLQDPGLGSGIYNAYIQSPYLNHAIEVAGGGDELLPEDLYLVDDFANAMASYQTDTNVDDLWQDLLSGAESPEPFVGLGTPVFGRSSAVTLAAQIEPSPVAAFDAYEGSSYISVSFNQNEFRDFLTGRQTMRVGDMLLPLAVGAYRTPLEVGPNGSTEPASPDGQYVDNPVNRIMQYEAQWTTLGESLAAAAGYSDSVGPPSTRVASGGVDDPFADLSFETDSSGIKMPKQDTYVLDRAHLRLDAFVPYIDMNAAAGSPPAFDEGTDIRRGLGIPMALAIFDMAQAGSETGLVAKGGIDRPVMGTINTNTAEASVLRLSPVLAKDVFDVNTGGLVVNRTDRLWWPETLRQTTVNETRYWMNAFETRRVDSSGNRIETDLADVGSTIVDYREAARTTRIQQPGGLGGATPDIVSDTTLGYVDPSEEERGLLIDRSASSGIDDIRNQPGIGSMGELFAARNVIFDPADPNSSTLNNPHLNNHHHMDGFARDNRTSGVGFIDRGASGVAGNNGRGMFDPQSPTDFLTAGGLGMDIATYGEPLTGDLIGASYASRLLTDPALTETDLEEVFPGFLDTAGMPVNDLLPIMPDQIPDDYDEQLIQLNAVLNTMSVGSDYYAVWFILHGYQESDTQNLGALDPLTPSFKGRYLMILDRSNVTKKGDEPRVLAFVQLPDSLPPAP